jgi:predicted pyridoxine 5'-phosphate oxidase superfamily flavin-nucleotide-binding protein
VVGSGARVETGESPAAQEELSPPIVEALAGRTTPKFLATLDAADAPNVVPILSLEAADARTLIFGELMIWKTRRNLEVNPRVCVTLLSPALQGWVIKGDFLEFQPGGPYFDHIMASDAFRYNAYAGIRSAGVIRVREVAESFVLSRSGLLADMLRSRWAARRPRRWDSGVALPAPVREKFGRLQAAKLLAYLGQDGYPVAVPVLSLVPAGRGSLVLAGGSAGLALAGLRPGARVAVSVLTFEPLAYQVKGEFLGTERSLGRPVGLIRIDEVYSASPPLPGKRLA